MLICLHFICTTTLIRVNRHSLPKIKVEKTVNAWLLQLDYKATEDLVNILS